MSTLRLAPSSVEAGMRWTARLLTVLVVAIVVTFFIGEGGFNPLKLTPVEAVLMVFFGTICLGMVAAWRWELIGGAISVLCFTLFCFVELAVRGKLPLGFFFYPMLLPGVFFLLSGSFRRMGRT